jgi:hypothetical protein
LSRDPTNLDVKVQQKMSELPLAVPIFDAKSTEAAARIKISASLWAEAAQRRIGSARNNKPKLGHQSPDTGKGGTVPARPSSSISASGRNFWRCNRQVDDDGVYDVPDGRSSTATATSYADVIGDKQDLDASDEENILFA